VLQDFVSILAKYLISVVLVPRFKLTVASYLGMKVLHPEGA
jgi:hypothetical protein